MDLTEQNIFWITLTVKQESEGETSQGKLAVAYVIVNRMVRYGKTASQTVLEPKQFSCWNTDSPTRQRVDYSGNQLWDDCFYAAKAAYNLAVPDPTRGSLFYYNPKLAAPAWAHDMRVMAKIGNHVFLKP